MNNMITYEISPVGTKQEFSVYAYLDGEPTCLHDDLNQRALSYDQAVQQVALEFAKTGQLYTYLKTPDHGASVMLVFSETLPERADIEELYHMKCSCEFCQRYNKISVDEGD